MMTRRSCFNLFVLLTGLLATGCNSIVTAPGSVVGPGGTGASFSGMVMAAGKPVKAASVQLFAAGTTGNGSAGTALLNGALTTDTGGAFTVPSSYACPASNSQVYLLAKGGSTSSSGGENSSLALMSALGTCSGIATGSSVVVNESTSVAAVTALAAFYSEGGNIGATFTNVVGLANAFTAAGNLVNVNSGIAPGASAPATLTEPVAKLNTLANALSACAGAAACAPLFAAATPTSGSAPNNTLDAAFNILRHPANNVAAVYQLASASSVFSPALAAAPPDWMLYATLTGGGVSAPTAIAVDAAGSVWVANYTGAVSAFTSAGAAVSVNGFTGGGMEESWGLAVAPSGNIWVANYASAGGVNSTLGTVTELSSSGAVLSGTSGNFSGGIEWPIALAADTNGNIWVVNNWQSVTLLNSSGVPLSGASGWGVGQLNFPVAAAVDANHNAWVANSSGTHITSISADGSKIASYSCCDGPTGIATDQSGNVWAANYYGNSVSVVATTGTILSTGITGGGINHPQGIAIDGAGVVWVANYRGYLSELAGTSAMGTVLSPASGFGSDASLLESYSIALDASGNLWVSNYGNSTVTEFIGIATPVKTPLAGPPQTP
jgi:hypothetical protein